MGVLTILQKLKRSPYLSGLRKYLNLAYYDPGTVILHLKNFEYVVIDDLKFTKSDQLDSLQFVKDNPWFDNIREGDIALDLGANIGAIALPLAKRCKRVYAVEPLFFQELKTNLIANGITNVEILPLAIDQYSNVYKKFTFSSKSGISQTIEFTDLMEKIGKVDWLKIDIEGGEWGIGIADILSYNIRELRVEFHIRRSSSKLDIERMFYWINYLAKHEYRCVYEEATPPLCAPFKACYLLRAGRIE